jgi:cold-inducible RNA-binding protein
MSARLYVGNLSFKTTERELHDAFAAHGGVEKAELVIDRDTQRPKGFGFVEMMTPEDAAAAIEALNESELGGRNIKVELARPREARADGPNRNREGRGRARGGARRWED